MEYADGATEDLTQQRAKSVSMSSGFADERGDALRGSGVSEHAGFPNPATDRSIQTLDLNTLLIRHSAATYLMRIVGDDWRHIGILNGDIVLVDRALACGANDLVVWWQGENFAIGYRAQVPVDTETWGVVSSTIHRYKQWNAKT